MSDDLMKMAVVAVAGLIVGAGVAVGLVEPAVTDKPPETPAVHAPCPDGWEDTSTADEHTIVLSCARNNWLVVLNPDGSFGHGVQLNTEGAQFKFSPAEVPGWPAR